MKVEDLQGKLVAILGYGMEGRAVLKYLMLHGVKPTLFDQKPLDDWSVEEQNEIKKLGLNFIFGPDCFKELAGFDVAFRSPGIRLKQLTINNLQLTSQTKFFFENCPAKIIGVTGTKGKGTTSALIYEMLKCSAPIHRPSKKPINGHTTGQIYITGNIGKTQPLDFLDNLKPVDWVVYELSSFQLQDLQQSPHIGVVLMVTSEHLDYHHDNEEYIEAKGAITKFQSADDFAIINSDFEASMKIGQLGKGKKLYFNRKSENRETKLRGEHNLENINAAVLAARCAGVADDSIINALKDFKGLEHRLEFVAERNGVKFYNDSFSTTPETAIAAIKSFREPLIIILGGSSKNSDFTELGKTIAESKNIKAIILVGEESSKIKNVIQNTDSMSIMEGAQNMQEIFGQIKSVASSGNVVLLSPACASFGMFQNYKDRGDQFKREAMGF